MYDEIAKAFEDLANAMLVFAGAVKAIIDTGPVLYTVETQIDGDGQIVGAGDFLAGTVVTLTAVPDPGNDFLGWGGACNGVGPCVLTIDGDKIVSAEFAPTPIIPPPPVKFTLTTSVQGAGSVLGSGLYLSGTTVPVVASPDPGSQFAGWTGACTGTGSCNVLMDDNKSVGAIFSVVAPATVTWTPLQSNYSALQGNTVQIGVNAVSSEGFPLTFTLASGSLAGTGVTLVGGNLVIGVGAAVGTISGLSLAANDGHGHVSPSSVFSLTVQAVPILEWRAFPDVDFDFGVAGQTLDLNLFMSNPNAEALTFTLDSGVLPAGVTLISPLLAYDGSSPVTFEDVFFRFNTSATAFSVPDADVHLFAINDSAADGAGAAASHPLAKLYWKSTVITYPQSIKQSTYAAVGTGYGDCLGTDGLAIPTSLNYFSRITLPALGTAQDVSINATALMNFWIGGHPNFGMTLIGSTGSISNFTRRTDPVVANRPTLNIVRSDGTSVSVPCAAHRSLIAPTTGTAGADIDCTAGVGSLILHFDWTGIPGLTSPVQSATLLLRGQTRGTPNTISLYATDMSYVLRAQAPVPGLANASVKDAALIASYTADLALAAGGSPPSRPAGGVLYAETWPDISGMDARNYYQRSSGGTATNANFTLVTASDPLNPAYAPLASGINALKITMNAGAAVACNLVWPFNGVWGYAPDHLWVRFYLMLGHEWPFYDSKAGVGNTSRGKFPFAPCAHMPGGKANSPIGMALRPAPSVAWAPGTVLPQGGNGGDPATGACMFSARNYWYVVGDTTGGVPTAAVHGPLAMAGYWPISAEDMYSADQYGPFGDDNFWASERTLAGLMKKSTWREVEIRIKLNSLHTAAGAGPDPVHLGNVRHMPYRTNPDTLVNDQLGHDAFIETFTDHILFGNVTGERYCTGQAPHGLDTAVLNSATQYATSSMIGKRDGIYEVRIEGVLVHRRTDMRWRHIPDVKLDCLWFDYGQTQLIAGSAASIYLTQVIAVDGDLVTGPIGPMRMS